MPNDTPTRPRTEEDTTGDLEWDLHELESRRLSENSSAASLIVTGALIFTELSEEEGLAAHRAIQDAGAEVIERILSETRAVVRAVLKEIAA